MTMNQDTWIFKKINSTFFHSSAEPPPPLPLHDYIGYLTKKGKKDLV